MRSITFAVLIAALAAIGSGASAPAPAKASASAKAGAPLPDSSLYQLQSRWQRDDGRPMKLEALRGQTRVVSMFFTGCNNLCPMILGQLKSLEAAMPAALKEDVGFVMVTLDSKGDSPAALRKYREESHLSAAHWTLLRGSADDTRELASLLGVRYTPKQDDGQMGHNGLIAIVDRDGRVLFHAPGIADQKDFLARLGQAVSGGPSVAEQ
jgi:protein SCO1/2